MPWGGDAPPAVDDLADRRHRRALPYPSRRVWTCQTSLTLHGAFHAQRALQGPADPQGMGVRRPESISIHSDDILTDHELATIQGGFIPAVVAGVATWKIATAAVGSIGLVFAAGAGLGYLANRP